MRSQGVLADTHSLSVTLPAGSMCWVLAGFIPWIFCSSAGNSYVLYAPVLSKKLLQKLLDRLLQVLVIYMLKVAPQKAEKPFLSQWPGNQDIRARHPRRMRRPRWAHVVLLEPSILVASVCLCVFSCCVMVKHRRFSGRADC